MFFVVKQLSMVVYYIPQNIFGDYKHKIHNLLLNNNLEN